MMPMGESEGCEVKSLFTKKMQKFVERRIFTKIYQKLDVHMEYRNSQARLIHGRGSRGRRFNAVFHDRSSGASEKCDFLSFD
ncbi:hypothetical protein KIN20_031774 [Parelaphostrongylus tenuis]|uniref:Uncharacterized protein n=1 Tax=Parelaphostrongylus tenuis TaxID=148309 RepID=A0AAD5WHZ6_PARTN|nr:hypothetical protein KIN20_031774 [Parelaphostrongylus tenuis]